jgi:prefoldin subunit 5
MHDQELIAQVYCVRVVLSELQTQLNQIKSLLNGIRMEEKFLKNLLSIQEQGQTLLLNRRHSEEG